MSESQDTSTVAKGTRGIVRTAHVACAYSAFTLIYQIVLRILPDSIALPGGWYITDLVALGLNLSIWGGLVAVFTACLVMRVASSRAIEGAFWFAAITIPLSFVGALMAFGTIPWIA